MRGAGSGDTDDVVWSDIVIDSPCTSIQILEIANKDTDLQNALQAAGCEMLCIFEAELEYISLPSIRDAAIAYMYIPDARNEPRVREALQKKHIGLDSVTEISRNSGERWRRQAMRHLAGLAAMFYAMNAAEEEMETVRLQSRLSQLQAKSNDVTNQKIGDCMALQAVRDHDAIVHTEMQVSALRLELWKANEKNEKLLREFYEKLGNSTP